MARDVRLDAAADRGPGPRRGPAPRRARATSPAPQGVAEGREGPQRHAGPPRARAGRDHRPRPGGPALPGRRHRDRRRATGPSPSGASSPSPASCRSRSRSTSRASSPAIPRSSRWACRSATRSGETMVDLIDDAVVETSRRPAARQAPRSRGGREGGRRAPSAARCANVWGKKPACHVAGRRGLTRGLGEASGAHDRPPQPRRHRGAGPRGRLRASTGRRSAPRSPSRCRSPSTASRSSS